MTNLNVIMNNLIHLKEQYEYWVQQKESAETQEDLEDVIDYPWWTGEYEEDLTWQIDCHVIFEGDEPCLLDERHIEMDRYGRYKEHCAECKAKWLMKEFDE